MPQSTLSDQKNENDDDVIVWGAKAIGAEIYRTERQARHLLDQRLLKGVFKLGGRYGARRGALRAFIRELEEG